MGVRERILSIRLIEMAKKQPDYISCLGLDYKVKSGPQENNKEDIKNE